MDNIYTLNTTQQQLHWLCESFGGDESSMICRVSHLWFGVSHHLAGEGDRHPLKDFIVFELLVKGGCRSSAGAVFIVLHVLVRLLYGRTLKTEFNFTDQALLEAGHLVFLKEGKKDTNTQFSDQS